MWVSLYDDRGQVALPSQGFSVNHDPSEAVRSVPGHAPLLSASLAGAEVSGAAFLQKTLRRTFTCRTKGCSFHPQNTRKILNVFPSQLFLFPLPPPPPGWTILLPPRLQSRRQPCPPARPRHPPGEELRVIPPVLFHIM